jgi:hypothetical protein
MGTDNFDPIAVGDEYTLSAAPDGLAYMLTFKTDGMAAHLQGEDAARFQTDYQTIRAQYPDWPADQTLAQLWDQGGYGWLAKEIG